MHNMNVKRGFEKNRSVRQSIFILTQHVQICPSGDRGGAAASERSFTFVVSAVSDQWTADCQTTAKVPEASVYQNAIFPPCNTEFNERPGDRRGEIRINTGRE